MGSSERARGALLAQKDGRTVVASSSVGVRWRRGEREVLLQVDKTPRNAGQVWNWEFIVHAHVFPRSGVNPVNDALLRREVWPMNRTGGALLLLCTLHAVPRLKSRSDGDAESELHAPGAASASLFKFTDLGGSTEVQ